MDKEDLGQLRKSYDKSSLDLSDVGDDPIGFFKNGLMKHLIILKLKKLTRCP